MKLVFPHMTIDDVTHKEVTVGGKKSADGKIELLVESAGWYIRIGNLSYYVGDDEPPFKKGDKVKLTMEQEK